MSRKKRDGRGLVACRVQVTKTGHADSVRELFLPFLLLVRGKSEFSGGGRSRVFQGSGGGEHVPSYLPESDPRHGPFRYEPSSR